MNENKLFALVNGTDFGVKHNKTRNAQRSM